MVKTHDAAVEWRLESTPTCELDSRMNLSNVSLGTQERELSCKRICTSESAHAESEEVLIWPGDALQSFEQTIGVQAPACHLAPKPRLDFALEGKL